MTEIRINKYLSEQGIASRRKADQYLLEKRIRINDKVAKLGDKVDLSTDKIFFDDKLISVSTPDKIYYALNKPKGVVSTVTDEKNRQTVIDLLPQSPRVYPVGRLDINSTGLMILTNDGDLTKKLTHPSFKHEKEYEVLCKVIQEDIDQQKIIKSFKKGLFIDGKLMKTDRTEVIETPDPNLLLLKITLHTGYNRQIRRMCDKIDLKVLSLKREKIAKLSLSELGLRPGEYKVINIKDIL